MKLNNQELRYLLAVLNRAQSFTVAQAEQVVSPSVRHDEVVKKIEDLIYRLEG